MNDPQDNEFIDIEVNIPEPDPKRDLAKKLDAVGWALFFIMIGCLWMVPEGKVPDGSWLAGVGIIMLGVNAFRSLFGLKVIVFTLFLGILALALGLSDMYALSLPVFPILLIIVGVSIIFGLFKHK